LDVGCGTGILSMFAARAGAAKVFSVDNSDIIEKAREIVKENNLDDIISFHKGKVETIDLPVDKVDIIISEWMGYFLLYEGMLDSVLVARDRWLKSDGLMAPSCTKILFSAVGDAEWYNDRVNFWNNVYGFSMTPMNQDFIKNGLITVLPSGSMISNSIVIKDIQTKTITVPELDFQNEFSLDILSDGKVYAFCGWFDTFFEGQNIDPVMFSTSPSTTPTHWMQTAFILKEPVVVEKGDVIFGSFICKKSVSNPRELVVVVEWKIKDKDVKGTQEFGVV
jgi:SAM-dependent methyltransferase